MLRLLYVLACMEKFADAIGKISTHGAISAWRNEVDWSGMFLGMEKVTKCSLRTVTSCIKAAEWGGLPFEILLCIFACVYPLCLCCRIAHHNYHILLSDSLDASLLHVVSVYAFHQMIHRNVHNRKISPPLLDSYHALF